MICPFVRLRGLYSITALPAVGQKDTPSTNLSSTPSIPALPEIAEKKYHSDGEPDSLLLKGCS